MKTISREQIREMIHALESEPPQPKKTVDEEIRQYLRLDYTHEWGDDICITPRQYQKFGEFISANDNVDFEITLPKKAYEDFKLFLDNKYINPKR